MVYWPMPKQPSKGGAYSGRKVVDARHRAIQVLKRWLASPLMRKYNGLANPALQAALVLLPYMEEAPGLNLPEFKERVRNELSLLASGAVEMTASQHGYKLVRSTRPVTELAEDK